MVRSFVVRALMLSGYQVLEAENGEHALEVMRGHAGEVALLLTDVIMPKMNGTELASRVRAADLGIGPGTG